MCKGAGWCHNSGLPIPPLLALRLMTAGASTLSSMAQPRVGRPSAAMPRCRADRIACAFWPLRLANAGAGLVQCFVRLRAQASLCCAASLGCAGLSTALVGRLGGCAAFARRGGGLSQPCHTFRAAESSPRHLPHKACMWSGRGIMLPRMLLHRLDAAPRLPKPVVTARLTSFFSGAWTDFL